MKKSETLEIVGVRRHLIEHLGPPTELYAMGGNPSAGSRLDSLQIAYFAPKGAGAPVVFATCGLAACAMDDGHRVEAIMLCRREPSIEAAAALRSFLGSFAILVDTQRKIEVGDVVRDASLRSFSSLDAVLCLPPITFAEGFQRAQVTRDRTVDLLWLVPVYDAEIRYAKQHGISALLVLFSAHDLDLTVPGRPPADTKVGPKAARARAEKRSAEIKPPTVDPISPTRAQLAQKEKAEGGGSIEAEDHGTHIKVVRRIKPKKPKGSG